MKPKQNQHAQDQIKALHISSKQAEIERNGGGQWVAVNRPHKNKKKYDRKNFKKETRKMFPYFFFAYIRKFLYFCKNIIKND